MLDYSYILGDTVKKARAKLGLTQSEVAEAAGIDMRTVLNIENNRGNPKFNVLFSLMRVLKIDPYEIFNPESQRCSNQIYQLRTLINECTDLEAQALISVIEAVLTAMRSNLSENDG